MYHDLSRKATELGNLTIHRCGQQEKQFNHRGRGSDYSLQWEASVLDGEFSLCVWNIETSHNLGLLMLSVPAVCTSNLNLCVTNAKASQTDSLLRVWYTSN